MITALFYLLCAGFLAWPLLSAIDTHTPTAHGRHRQGGTQ